MMISPAIDEQYYREVPRGSVAERVFISARERIFRDFMARMRPSPSDQILDVDVSEVVNDGANVLEGRYPHQNNVTACGLGTGAEFKKAFPQVRYVQIGPNARLPFDDSTFDIATSNAVLEHTGSFENQSFFLHEIACRITGKSEWAREENLILMTRKQLWQLAAPTGKRAAVGYTGVLLGAFSSNLYLTLH
jgi:Methyltransferase domain